MLLVIPAKAGIQEKPSLLDWIPAFAGMTALNKWLLRILAWEEALRMAFLGEVGGGFSSAMGAL
jgi:hypothetical protein